MPFGKAQGQLFVTVGRSALGLLGMGLLPCNT
jgi:hypothetical protein